MAMTTRAQLAGMTWWLLALAGGCGGGQSGSEGLGGDQPLPPSTAEVAECPCAFVRADATAMRAEVLAAGVCGVTLGVLETLAGEGFAPGDELMARALSCSELPEPEVGTEVIAVGGENGVLIAAPGETLALPPTDGIALADVEVLLDAESCNTWFDDNRPMPPPDEDLGELEPGAEPPFPPETDDPVLVRSEPVDGGIQPDDDEGEPPPPQCGDVGAAP
jgi:hypothetical protein